MGIAAHHGQELNRVGRDAQRAVFSLKIHSRKEFMSSVQF